MLPFTYVHFTFIDIEPKSCRLIMFCSHCVIQLQMFIDIFLIVELCECS